MKLIFIHKLLILDLLDSNPYFHNKHGRYINTGYLFELSLLGQRHFMNLYNL